MKTKREGSDENQTPSLGGTTRDWGTALAKGVAGAVPFAGGIIAEIIGKVIPEQRIERIEVYLRYLNERLELTMDQTNASSKMKDPENVALFEDGALQSARAIFDERKRYIARIVAHGIAGDEKERIEAKRLLNLLGEIDDEQIIILTSHLDKFAKSVEFKKKHEDLLRPYVTLNDPEEVRERFMLSQVAKEQLVGLGLLHPVFQRQRDGRQPEFDPTTGTLKIERDKLSPIGRLLLIRLGIANPEDYW